MQNLWNHSSIFFFSWLDVFAAVGMTRCSQAIWPLAQDLIQKINSNTIGVHRLQQSRHVGLLHNPAFCNSPTGYTHWEHCKDFHQILWVTREKFHQTPSPGLPCSASPGQGACLFGGEKLDFESSPQNKKRQNFYFFLTFMYYANMMSINNAAPALNKCYLARIGRGMKSFF